MKFPKMRARSGRSLRLFGVAALLLGLTPVLSAQSPAHMWSKAFGSATNDQGNAVATDASGNVYLTGSFSGTASFGGQNLICASSGCLFLAKFAPDGTPLWSSSFNNDSGSGKAVAIDAGGNVLLAGSFSNANFGCGIISGPIFAAKLAPNGSCLWSNGFRSVATAGTGSAGGYDVLNGLAIDAGGNVFLAGMFGCSTNLGCAINFGGGLITSNQQLSYGGIFLTKLSGTDGSQMWADAYGDVSSMDYATGVAVDGSGNAFITGYFSSSVLNLGGSNLTNAGGADVFLAKYQGSNGAPLWSKRFGGVSNDYGMAIAIDSGGAAVITGQFQYVADFGGIQLTTGATYPDVFLARYASADGTTLWAKAFGGTIADSGRGIATDGSGHIFLTGYLMSTASFGGGVSLTSNGSEDVFLAEYNAADGSTLWAKDLGGVSHDVGLGVTIDSSGNTLMTGYFVGPVDFGGGPINGGGFLDIFLAKYGSGSSKAAATVTLSNLTQTYTGSPLTPTATTSPAGLAIAWTNAPQTNAGSYAVTATVNDPNYQGSASGKFTISTSGKTTATVTLSNLTQTYTGSPLTPTATTNPAGLAVVWTNAPQTNAGSYAVTATVNDPNYQGSASGTFTISTSGKTTATVTLSNLTQTYTGSPLTPTATTNPAGLAVVWTNAPQTNAGSYAVTATISNPNYQGSAGGTFTISAAAGSTPPSVSITSPSSGTVVVKTTTVVILAATQQGTNPIARVDFLVNGAVTCSDATAPYTCSWTVPNPPFKTYQLQAKAYDSVGKIGTSGIVTVTSTK